MSDGDSGYRYCSNPLSPVLASYFHYRVANDLRRFEDFIAESRYRQFEEIRLIKLPDQEHGGLLAQLIPEILLRERVWAVVLPTGGNRVLPASVVLDLRLRGIRVLSAAAFWEHEGCCIDVAGADDSWVFDHGAFQHGRVSRAIKRGVDLSIAMALIALTFPLMLLVSILIKLESRGPILYRQQRVGLHGRPFVIYKFRSMRHDAEVAGIPQWATIGDPRVTRIGRFTRYTRIDELPELFNVLRGDMSLIGPRPERPYFVDQLVAQVPFYAQRHCVKPGITGWAQINAPYGASLEDARDKLRYDLYYVKNRSFLLDLWILACTVQVVLFREGAR
jgi:exopolysaccharide biosynthesis polyprenyl glycosylphosphotransferase